MPTLEHQLQDAFARFSQDLAREAPWARENELVSLFAFGPLADVVADGAPLFSQRQIAIECAVPQRVNAAKSGRAKRDVRKDLLIWKEAGMTAWDATGRLANDPIAVIEWKGGRAKAARRESLKRDHDLRFLRAFVKATGNEAYSAHVRWTGNDWHVNVARITSGAEYPHWFDSAERAGV
ncbi:hypothetical protein Strain138_002138 [Pseudogemmatithrix spongiicola]|uniref:Uncharacterized protein n=1 Tax=Pseudogemmatithrix spongiicola TaxID=3062599 RepID=A0AA49JWD6_9BACT|nr:hypothetical protein Strain138_002138 [Gemmatimonadaceae bacterium 'strain 138']WKW15735.1 hypothetical protein Strain318_002137 [Gemmatimonadaceae bacterium 'strain 318']